MGKHTFWRVTILVVLVVGLLYMLVNKDFVIKEHLTPGTPTLSTLQNDTKELDKKLDKLKKEFDDMSSKAKEGADAAAQAKAQAALLKTSSTSTIPSRSPP
jgi:peptidoglycan hydrolase CwlO-like protein